MRLPWLALFFSLIVTPVAADRYLSYHDGLEEYDRGNTAAALATYERLAESGDSESQGALGFMFYIGDAVTQNFRTAAMWFHRAAEQGLTTAQYNLAIMYENGQGVGRSDVEADRWFTLAEFLARNSDERDLAKGNRHRIEKHMSKADLAAAHRLACGWWQKNAWLLTDAASGPADCTEAMR